MILTIIKSWILSLETLSMALSKSKVYVSIQLTRSSKSLSGLCSESTCFFCLINDLHLFESPICGLGNKSTLIKVKLEAWHPPPGSQFNRIWLPLVFTFRFIFSSTTFIVKYYILSSREHPLLMSVMLNIICCTLFLPVKMQTAFFHPSSCYSQWCYNQYKWISCCNIRCFDE